MTKEEFDIAFNQAVNEATQNDIVGDDYCVMVVGDMSVGMSREQYDKIMESAIKELIKREKP